MNNKTMKRNVLVSALLAIALCLSVMVGATFALFTSESKTNIAVTSGKVDVIAYVDEASVQTKQLNAAYQDGKTHMYEATATFADGGLKVNNFVPGDGIQFNIVVKNNSSISVKYRTIIACDAADGLLEGLNVTIGGESYQGTTKISSYTTLAATQTDVAAIPVSIELPETAGNEYQNQTFQFSYKVEAIQGNAETTDPDASIYYVYNVRDLMTLSNREDVSNWQTVETIEFLADIDLTGLDFVSITKENTVGLRIQGNGHTIKGLKAPLYASMNGANFTINNLTIDNAEMTTTETYSGLFIAYADICEITMNNCHATNSKITGDDTRVGALIGYMHGELTMKDCSADNCELKSNGTVGGLVAQTVDYVHPSNPSRTLIGQTIENCEVKNCKLTATDEDWRVGAILGTVQGTSVINGCTLTNNTLKMNYIAHEGQQIANPNHEAFGRIVDGSLEIDGMVYCDAAYLKNVLAGGTSQTKSTTLYKNYTLLGDWTPIEDLRYRGAADKVTSLKIDGNGKTIYGLNDALIWSVEGLTSLEISNLTIDNAKINGSEANGMGIGAFVKFVQNGMVTLDGCKVTNSDIIGTGDYSVAALIGYAAIGVADDSHYNIVTVKNCTIENVTINSQSNAAGIVGYVQSALENTTTTPNLNIDNVAISNLTLVGERENKVGTLVGTVNTGAIVNISNIDSADGQIGRTLSTGVVQYN